MAFIDVSTGPRRVVGVVPDIDDEHLVPGPVLTVYHPFEQQVIWGGRLFVHARQDPYALVPGVTRIVRGLSVDQPVERAATLEDIRAEVLTPDRLNAVVFGGFAAVALAIAVVGVAGVLAFSVSGRTREFGIRLAIGSEPRHLLTAVIAEGALIAVAGVVAGALGGFAAGAPGGQLSRGREAAGRPARGRLGDRAAGGRGRRVGAARGARRAHQRDAGAALGMTPVFAPAPRRPSWSGGGGPD